MSCTRDTRHTIGPHRAEILPNSAAALRTGQLVRSSEDVLAPAGHVLHHVVPHLRPRIGVRQRHELDVVRFRLEDPESPVGTEGDKGVEETRDLVLPAEMREELGKHRSVLVCHGGGLDLAGRRGVSGVSDDDAARGR
jgi:hypothetical protein